MRNEDAQRYLGGRERIHVIPIVPTSLQSADALPRRIPKIGFIGNCTFLPNEEGIEWFMRDVWAAH